VPACIHVLAGVNGAGKSSIGGAAIQAAGAEYFNPDLAARALMGTNPGMDVQHANAIAWELGRQGLERALREDLNYAFETSLGGNTIPGMLLAGAKAGAKVHVWYAGLSSPELHIQRVSARVRAGGHDIPQDTIRARYRSSRANLIRLLPRLASLRVLDNSLEADPRAALTPQPILLLHCERGRITRHVPLAQVPTWAKPIMAAAFAFSATRSHPS
jgi:predicted ABC-type ATPase